MTTTVILTYKVANSFVKDDIVFKDLKVSETLFQVTATENFNDFKPKRVVLQKAPSSN